MPCGAQLIEAVASLLNPDDGHYPETIRSEIHRAGISSRAIRYAITELIRSGRARRDGKYGPVYAVRSEGGL